MSTPRMLMMILSLFDSWLCRRRRPIWISLALYFYRLAFINMTSGVLAPDRGRQGRRREYLSQPRNLLVWIACVFVLFYGPGSRDKKL
jgi:hypothetical protein